MLKRIGTGPERAYRVPIGEAGTGGLFAHHPEFNPPAHGTWNIVHVGMLVPQAHQIYVCGVNCMRGVVLTAAEMGQSDRFSMVILEEEDLIQGTVEEVTLEGVASVLEKLEKAGFEAYVVGGCVRDALLGLVPKDYDEGL